MYPATLPRTAGPNYRKVFAGDGPGRGFERRVRRPRLLTRTRCSSHLGIMGDRLARYFGDPSAVVKVADLTKPALVRGWRPIFALGDPNAIIFPSSAP